MSETVGRYEILEKIGQGGMGSVYMAFDPVLRRTVAVKVISAVLDDKPEIRERFFREARAAGQLSHKNIIVIHDLGEANGQPFLAMEYLSGASLATRMSGGHRLSVTRAVDIMIEVCDALEYAHARGIVHRDITPANIFVTETEQVKILDFGLAHLVSSELTRSETVIGTANYMSPEQVRGERIDRRSDIFAAGVVLYELLAGRRAFEGDSFANTLFKVLASAPPPLHTVDPTLPGPLVGVVERALAKRREDRYQTAAEMQQELVACRGLTSGAARPMPAITLAETVANGQPPIAVAAMPPPFSAPWSPRRVRTTAIVGGLLAITAALVLVGLRDNKEPIDPGPQATQAPATQSAPAPVAAPVVPPPAATNVPDAPSTPSPPAASRGSESPRVNQADRARADAAIARARQTRALADSAGADTVSAYRQGIATEGEAAGLYAAGQFALAATRAGAAEALYRAAEIQARAEQTARERLPAESTPPPAAAPPAEAPRAETPRVEAPPPAKPEPAPMPEAPDPREAIRSIVAQYVAALEARSLGALKALWPSLPAAQERAIRSEFANARTLQVRLADVRTDVNGASAVVTAEREYQIVTTDGHRLSSTTRMTMRLRRSGETWTIEGVTYQ